MSEIKKIGMYTTDEILEFMADGEGRGFMGRSMYDAIYFKIEELEKQLQQKENIIKEVRECLNKNRVYIAGERNLAFEIEQILDKDITKKKSYYNYEKVEKEDKEC